MKKLQKILAVTTAVMVLGATSITVFAASQYRTPAEAVAGITGRTVESVTAERYESGKTYGTIANDAGKLEAYQKEVIEMGKDRLQVQVQSGRITQAQADALIKAMEENQANCDGTGLGGACGGIGGGCGNGGANRGTGRGMSGGGGQRLQDGSCYMYN